MPHCWQQLSVQDLPAQLPNPDVSTPGLVPGSHRQAYALSPPHAHTTTTL